MKRLSIPQIVMMHSALIKETGGLDGIRDENLLDSAVNAPFQTFGGEYVYKTLEAKAARLGYSLVKNHPFVDGNKRIGMLAMLVFLEINGIELTCSDQDIIETGLKLAAGEMDDKQLLEWILRHN
ncbi:MULTISPECIES: type II toxin-antitoxin system death-on-curing family toxin [Bacillota]|mgnify:CR=1 FL=1|jgi:death-on-curing protein|uniref:type II toxin-antitoxin system death-on-curing family toxin n=1 Tax=Bacillota TaxID=1239 RepID=UPI0004898D61|nr:MULTISPECIES: type II toxin-antitoxin system death-on-curing family toxin [Bacillota]NSW89936.1 type II toxin-antitoxin system death-on-curing family toxin [Bacillota bacterium]